MEFRNSEKKKKKKKPGETGKKMMHRVEAASK